MMKHRRITALLMALFMLTASLGLTACNKNGGDGDTGSGNGSGSNSTSDITYNATYTDWVEGGSPEIIGCRDGVLTALLSKYEEDSQTCSIETINLDTMEKTSTPLQYEMNSDTYIGNLTMLADGKMVGIMVKGSHTKEDYSDYTSTQHLVSVALDGTVSEIAEIQDVLGDKNTYVQSMCVNAEGKFFIAVGGEDESKNKVLILDAEAKKIGEVSIGSWVENMVITESGTVYVNYWGNEGRVSKKIDATGNVAGEIKLTGNGGNMFAADAENVFMLDGNTLILTDMSTGESKELLNWMNIDIDGNNIRYVSTLSDGRLLAISSTYGESVKSELIILTPGEAGQNADKKEITFACLYLDEKVKENILDFNKNNAEYRITVKEYSTDDWETGIAQFNNDLTSGNMPDIIDFSSGINPATYASKGLLEDLYSYIDSDPDMKREDFLENVFGACEIDGKLYFAPTMFSVNTLVGRASLLGDEPGWTMEEMMAYVNEQPQGTQIFEYATKESVLYTCALNNMGRYVNWETGECNFETKEFVDILNFANTFVSSENYEYDSSKAAPEMIESNSLLFMELYLSDPGSYQVYNQIFKGDMTAIGYPNSDGTNGAILLNSSSQLAISSKSKNKDAAWQFIRMGLLDEYQEDEYLYAFPVKKTAFEKVLQDSMKETDGGASWGWGDGYTVTVGATTQEEVDEIRTLIENTTSFSTYDEEINKIVNEETKPFFEGQKSANDVAKIIQSRVQIYVNENR